MKQPLTTGVLFPDHASIQQTLERRTRDALLKRLGPSRQADALPVPPPDPAERSKAKGIGFSIDLVRAILEGRKTQTRRLVRPRPTQTPRTEDCPLGRPGGLLYVREPWLRTVDAAGRPHFQYAADTVHAPTQRFRPGMYMPRDAARMWLRLRAVRAEPVRSISADDLAAEGLPPGQTLESVWDTFYSAPGERWADDPWVWVLHFSVEAS